VYKAVKAKGGYLKNLKYKIYFDLTLFGLLHDSICVVSVLMCTIILQCRK
jgi:hypothetical protein